jgi:UDPglucose--hexose-1-phosphate uridylyltransferase
MPELRKDPIVDRWVIIATDRARRPQDYASDREPARTGVCPFCPGQEGKTPHELLAHRPPDGPASRPNVPGWSLRVFPNKFPALKVEGALDREGDGPYDRMNGIGAHEVIVETPDHTRGFGQLSVVEMESVLTAYRDRMLDLQRDLRFRYVMVFRNYGRIAGASVDHPHSQLVALPVVPTAIARELEGARAYYAYKERCVFCDIIHKERRDKARVIYENADHVVIAPYASRFPFETWVLPRQHRAALERADHAEMRGLADALRVAVAKLQRGLDDPPYNITLHTAPFSDGGAPHYHFHFEILPSLATPAGFEWGSGFHINPTPPEEAARFLRDVAV